jgi:predicted amidohydrolase
MMHDLNLTLIQTPLIWENPEANLEMLDRKIDSLPETAELVILPEMFTTGFSMRPEEFAGSMDDAPVRWMLMKTKQKNIILAGSLMIREDDHYYNRLLWVLPNGMMGFYDKRHLFGYAEENQHYQPGEKRLIARVKGWRICLVVCYDLRFPVWLRQPPEPENRYDLLVCVANWPGSRAVAWNTLLRARAIENECYVAGVNRTGVDGNGIAYKGDSCVIDPAGELLLTAGDDEASVLGCTISRGVINDQRRRFPFLDDADRFFMEK